MKLIIAEKPDMMKKISSALGNGTKRNKGYHQDDEFIFSNAVGHVVENKMPKEIDEKYKNWDVKNLPFHFEEIPLKVSSKTKDQYSILKKLATSDEISEIINACDSDREGELIFRNAFKTFPKNKLKNKKFTRMWLTATTKKAIQKSYDTRKNLKEYNNLADAAISRQTADYLVGMNGTMAMTSAFSGYQNVLSIGRVQTPTLKIIVDLEEKIKNFKSEPFWTLKGKVFKKDGDSDAFEASYFRKDLDKNRFFKKEEAVSTKEKIGTGNIEVVKVSDEDKKINPQKLYNLSDLQIDLGKRYGLGAQTVLSTAQALYEKHSLLSYPRTDENNISTEFASDIPEILSSIAPFEKARGEIKEKSYKIKSSFVVNKDKIGAHEAITPVLNDKSTSAYDNLNDLEKKVYDAVVQRFLEAFFPPAIKRVQKAALKRKSEIFQAQVENLKDEGFMKVKPPQKEKEEKVFPKIDEGDILDLKEILIEDGKTQPPSRFTEGSLIQTMKNPLKYVEEKRLKDVLKENQGVGTEATRASIIESLKKRNFISLEKKTIIPTSKGIELIKTIPSERVKSVALTGYFEEKLKKISEGEEKKESFLSAIQKLNQTFIDDIKEKMKTMPKDAKESFSKAPIAKCQNCGSNIISSKYGYYCEDKCGVSINKNALEKLFKLKTITESQAKQLLNDGETKNTVKLHSKKKNKDFHAKLTYEHKPNEKYPNNVWFKFEDNKKGGRKR